MRLDDGCVAPHVRIRPIHLPEPGPLRVFLRRIYVSGHMVDGHIDGDFQRAT
jgi:hypothetical protein